MNRIGMIIAILAFLGFCATTMLYTVNPAQYGVIYTFEEVREDTLRTEPGLYFKLPAPIQRVAFLDNRIQSLESTNPEPIMTRETTQLVVDWMVKWRIKDPKEFIRKNNGVDMSNAEQTLRRYVQNLFNNQITIRQVEDVLGNRQEVIKAVHDGLDSIAQTMGIEIVDVRLKRVDYAAATTAEVYQQMITQRKIEAQRLRSDGEAQKEAIKANADLTYQKIVSDAYKNAQTIMGEGDAEVTKIFAQAFGQDPQFAKFYRSLQAYRESFKNKSDIMLLDPKEEFFQYMRSPVSSAGTVQEANPVQIPQVDIRPAMQY